MNEYIHVLRSVELFKDMGESEILSILPCLAAKKATFSKGQAIFESGEHVETFGIVLAGQVQIVQDDYFGNRSILSVMGPGHLFAESFALAEVPKLAVSVIGVTEGEYLLINSHNLASPCSNVCSFHSKLIHNMMQIVSRKNIALTQKIEFTSKRSTREKLLAYLSAEAKKAGKGMFTIPMNRQELADFLYVDRSAMSAELSKMKKEGIVDYQKNQFELL